MSEHVAEYTDLQGKCSHESSLLSLMACTQNFTLQPRSLRLFRLLAWVGADLCSGVSVFVQAVITDKLGEDLREWSEVPVCACRRAERWRASSEFCF